jgi:hypothetical protein
MHDLIARARHYRDKAEEAARLVERMATAEGKRMFAAMAKDFLLTAERLERQAAAALPATTGEGAANSLASDD